MLHKARKSSLEVATFATFLSTMIARWSVRRRKLAVIYLKFPITDLQPVSAIPEVAELFLFTCDGER